MNALLVALACFSQAIVGAAPQSGVQTPGDLDAGIGANSRLDSTLLRSAVLEHEDLLAAEGQLHLLGLDRRGCPPDPVAR